MSKYDGLTQYLSEYQGDDLTLSFEAIGDMIEGDLPDSAYQHRPWWANRSEGRGGQNLAWQKAGWETRDVDMSRDTVRFVRVKPKAEPIEMAGQAGLTIAQAKAGLAMMFGLSEEQIEINIRA